MRIMASLLHKTLIEVKISGCAVASLRSLEPVQDLIERLHVDCVRDGCEEEHEYASTKQKCKYSSHPVRKAMEIEFSASPGKGSSTFLYGLVPVSLWLHCRWLALMFVCPNLEEIRIRVERDCRSGHKPSKRWAALLVILDCRRCSWIVNKRFCINDTVWAGGFAPVGEVLLEWNQEFKPVWAFDYGPPQEFKPANQRSLSLPGAGLLAECLAMRHL